MQAEINDHNAPSIGQPIIETIIKSHAQADYESLVKAYPELSALPWDDFNEAAQVLNPLGAVTSIEYLGRLNRIDEHLLLWKVQYEQGDEDVLWHLNLSVLESKVVVVGMSFDFNERHPK